MNKKAVGILVGGGPAPGINGVIRAATLEAIRQGYPVVGIRKGYELLMKGDVSAGSALTETNVAGIHRQGGSILFTSRANPTKTPDGLEKTVKTLLDMNVGFLVAIGGDDTASSARAVGRKADGRVAVVHVPKTIDNDLPLPDQITTFGFQTARDVGTALVDSLMEDARTTGRWYFAVAMGRKAGHLALGIGGAAGAPLTLIPEELGAGKVPFAKIVDAVVATMLREGAYGRDYGVIVLAEGLVEKIEESTLPDMGDVERDPHGHIRLAEVDFGIMMKRAVRARLAELGLPKWTIVEKNIGYELRCSCPNAFDREYTTSLGSGAVQHLLNGGNEAMMTRQRGKLVPIPFSEILDESTGRIRTHFVDLSADVFVVAQHTMSKLSESDFHNDEFLLGYKRLTDRAPSELKSALQVELRK